MELTHNIRTVATGKQQIAAFLRFAYRFRNDHSTLEFKDMSFDTLRKFLQSAYKLEEGEQILRSRYFWALGGDCDDAAIFCWALMFHERIPFDKILVCEARAHSGQGFTHIFAGLENPVGDDIFFDCLKEYDGDYADENLRITRASDYVSIYDVNKK